MQNFFTAIVAAIDSREPFALAIISAVRGSTPQKRGAKALFFADGRIVGTLGGGCLEAEVRERARQSLRTNSPAAFDLVLDHDFGWDDGLICGGRVSGLILPHAAHAENVWRELARSTTAKLWSVRKDFSIVSSEGDADDCRYCETVKPPCPLWIAGSGHVAQALAPLAAKLEFDVTILDDRPALANHERFPSDVHLRVDAWDKLLAVPANTRDRFGLIVTRGHQHDALVLRHWIQQPFAFLGMIGSQRKRRVIFSQFIEDGIATEEQLSRVECPVGIDIRAVSVTEIAVSVAARLVQRRAELNRE
jgi:xanthine dehydrogenase accessory factor